MKKIMIVDDDEGILEALQTAVESEGYEVITISHGEQLLKEVKTHHPDLLLLDLLLSGKDGSELARELKTHRETKHIPIIMLSAHPTAEQRAGESKADAFLAKPFDIQALFGLLEKHLKSNPSEKADTNHN